jgi:hypothetical protein
LTAIVKNLYFLADVLPTRLPAQGTGIRPHTGGFDMLKKLVGGARCAVAVVGLGSSAFAGEITGSGKGGPNGDGKPAAILDGHARSACAFSGLDDAQGYNGDVQNFGHIDDPAFLSVTSIKGAAFVEATLDIGLPEGPITVQIGCNPHAEGEG